MTSGPWAGIWSRSRRYATVVFAAPMRHTARAASIATLPPPTTTTRLPERSGASPSATSRRNSRPLYTPSASSPGMPSDGGARRAGGEENRVVALGLEGLDVVHAGGGDDLDADRRDVGDVLLDDLGGKAVGGERVAQEAAGLGLGLEDAHLVAQARELPRGGEAGGAGADDRDLLAVRGLHLDPGAVLAGVVAVGDEALEAADRDGALEGAAGALALARRVAGAAQRADQGSGVEDELEGLLVLAAADEGHVAVRLDARGARVDARRRARPLDDGLLRHRLRERDVRGAARDQVVVELVGHRDGAGGLALVAAGAGVPVDERGVLPNRRVEGAAGGAPDPRHLAVVLRGDVRVVDGRRHLGAGDAAGAVERREDLAQEDHASADARLLLDEEDLVAHVAELDRRLHAADAAADHHDVVVVRGPRRALELRCDCGPNIVVHRWLQLWVVGGGG